MVARYHRQNDRTDVPRLFRRVLEILKFTQFLKSLAYIFADIFAVYICLLFTNIVCLFVCLCTAYIFAVYIYLLFAYIVCVIYLPIYIYIFFVLPIILQKNNE